jgi:hypothetical protein
MNEIIETLRKADNEGTESPWWMLIDPKNIYDTIAGVAEHGDTPDMSYVLNAIAFAVEGPFFSREDAETYLKNRRYAYSDEAKVWCGSGYRSQKYKAFYRKLKSDQAADEFIEAVGVTDSKESEK